MNYFLLLNKPTFLSIFLLWSLVSIGQKESKDVLDSTLIPENAVEYFELSWPTDDVLCDSYPFSEGPMGCTIYRLKKSKKIVYVQENGAFCQGDSDFDNIYFFNKKGEAVYSTFMGIYAPGIVTFYKNGVPDLEIASPGEGEEEYAPIVREPEYTDSLLSKDMDKMLADYLKRRKDRLEFLKKMNFTPEQKQEEKEAKNLIEELENKIESEINWKGDCVFRLPKLIKWGELGEVAKLNTKNVTVYKDFDIKSKVIYKFTQNGENLEVLKQAILEEYYPGHITDWRCIRFTDPKTLKLIEGWIPTEFIMEEVFRKED